MQVLETGGFVHRFQWEKVSGGRGREFEEGEGMILVAKCRDCPDGQLILEITDDDPYPDAVCDKCGARIPFGLRRIKE